MAAFTNPPVQVNAGDVVALVFSVKSAGGGNPVYSQPTSKFKLTAQSFYGLPLVYLLEKTSVMSTSNGAWVSTLRLDKSDTISVPPGDYYYQLQVTDGSNTQIVADGILTIEPNVVG